MNEQEKEFHSLTRMEQLRIAEQYIKHLQEQLDSQPKPTGEWTADYVYSIGGREETEREWMQAVADAHNAELAAERRAFQKLVDQNTSYREALEAEKALSRGRMQQIERHQQELIELRELLAATVHYWQGVATQEWHKGFALSHDEHQKQLDAERERADACELQSNNRGRDVIRYGQEIAQLREKVQIERERTQAMIEAHALTCEAHDELAEKVQIVMRYIPACSEAAVKDALSNVK